MTTKLEELKATYAAASAAAADASSACDAADALRTDAYDSLEAAYDALKAELKRQEENSND